MSVLVKYQNQVQLTYSLNAYLPWEGLNVVFNGTEGRLEMKIVEKSYVNAGGKRENVRSPVAPTSTQPSSKPDRRKR